MFKQILSSNATRKACSLFLVLALVACLFVGESQANKNKGGEDIILYNGNIVLRGNGGGKGKGKGNGGSIVVANSPSNTDYMPMFGWGGGFRKRR